MKQILDKVNEIAEVLNNTNGVPNMEWVKNNVNELQKAVKEKCNLLDVMPSASRPDHICDDEWWCPNCQDTVVCREVTFDERHDKEGCYCPVI